MAHLVGRLPDPTTAEMVAEVRREQRSRDRVYPRQIAAGRLSSAEADRRRRVLTAVVADLSGGDGGAATVAEKVEEIERELVQRRRLYARWVKAGSLTLATAQLRIRALQAVADYYAIGARLL